MLGISGAWISNLTALDPYKPYVAGVTLALLGYGFWHVYFKPKPPCEDGSYCARPQSAWTTKAVLWLGLAVAILALTIDCGTAQDRPAATATAQKQTTFAIENMTCATCPITVKKAMEGVAGVTAVTVDFAAKTARATYNPRRTNAAAIAAASTNAGYPARAIQN
ncbi:hypothetical protein KXV85_010653 [Aspergillus fumigatus]|nr:hypothetical protein KXV85_010653 [Aspergillus fumigatus]